ncbi:MAG: gliding motility lipoprotein GldD [Bacteroidia bacterium]
MNSRTQFLNFQFSIFGLLLLTLLSLSSCTHDYLPKPRGYFRIDIPEKNYSRYSPPDCPFSFEIPQYAIVVSDTNRLAEPCWMYIKFPRFNGEIYLSYKDVKNNLDKYLEDAHTLVYKHTVKADQITEKRIGNRNNAYGVLYDIGGNAASQVQFFATDSSMHFLRGALYFNAVPNNDSIAPVLDFIKKDIHQLINTLEWKS